MHHRNINAYIAVLTRRPLQGPYCGNSSMHPHMVSLIPFPYIYICHLSYMRKRGVVLQASLLLGVRRTAYLRFFNDVHHISGVFQNLLLVVQKILIYPISRGSHRKIFSLKTFDEVSLYW